MLGIDLIIFISGLMIGSFLNVVIDRLPDGRNIFIGRSICDYCHTKLQWFDLFPLFSFLLLQGKCRYCHTKIPLRNFFTELLTGVLFMVIITINHNYYPSFILLFLAFASCLIVIFFIDMERGIIPDNLILAAFFLELLIHHVNRDNLLQYITAGIISFLFFFGIFYVTKQKGMGFGDVKFSFVIGFFLGFPVTIAAFYIAFLTGAVVSLILVITGKKRFKGGTIPFGPFLVFGMFVGYFKGAELIQSFLPFLLR